MEAFSHGHDFRHMCVGVIPDSGLTAGFDRQGAVHGVNSLHGAAKRHLLTNRGSSITRVREPRHCSRSAGENHRLRSGNLPDFTVTGAAKHRAAKPQRFGESHAGAIAVHQSHSHDLIARDRYGSLGRQRQFRYIAARLCGVVISGAFRPGQDHEDCDRGDHPDSEKCDYGTAEHCGR